MLQVSFQGGYDGMWYIYSDVPGWDWFVLVVQIFGGFFDVENSQFFGEEFRPYFFWLQWFSGLTISTRYVF